MKKLREEFEFRTIKRAEGHFAAEAEQICFPPNEACSRTMMLERVEKAPEMFLVAIEKRTGELVGLINGLPTHEDKLRDEFFKDANLYDPEGGNVMILGVEVLPGYRMKGIAAAMMEEYKLRERARGRKSLVLTCLEDKVAMYEKMGFKNEGISGSVWGGEEWYEMRCEL